MRKMRKLFAWLCVVALAVSMMIVPVFAADDVDRYEAEDAVYQKDPHSTSDDFMVGFTNNHMAAATFTVNAAAAGNYTVKVHYVSAGDTQMAVLVNGTKIGDVSFPKGDGSSLQTIEIEASLLEGENKIRIWNEHDTVKEEFKLSALELDGVSYPATDAFGQYNYMNVASEHAGFSGTGFMAGFFWNCGAHLQFTVTVETDGVYDVTVGYANGNSEAKGQDAKLGVYVNGSKQTDTLLSPGQTWATYLRKTEQLTLKAGTNTITYWYEDASVSAAPNFDYIEIAAKGTASDVTDPDAGDMKDTAEEHNKTVQTFAVSPTKKTTIEAEDAKWITKDPYKSVGASTEHSGYNGTGFVSGFWGNPGAAVEFPLEVYESADYKLTIRYANGDQPATIGIYIDGEQIAKYDFISSGGWSSWAEFAIDIPLTTENTSLSIVAEEGGANCCINVDSISLLSANAPEEVPDATTPGGNNSSTNVTPEADYTVYVLVAVGVLVLLLIVVVVLTYKNVLFKGNKFFDKVFKR